jgi:hypothetical protein
MLAALALTALAAGVSASPINVAEHIAPRALKETQQYLTIHESCNNTQRRMLERAFK